MSEGDEQTNEHDDAPSPEAVDSGTFAGLADLDEDLRTMSQSNAEVERWRRLSTRGLTPATGTTGEGGGLAAPIIEDDHTATVERSLEDDAHSASTAPGTIESPTEHASVRPPPISVEPPLVVPSADDTRKLSAITPEAGLPSIEAESIANARRSFAPLKDSTSAPPGSRVVLPRSSHPPPGRVSSRPVKVPRPSQPPPDPDEAIVRGWRASDPSEASDQAMLAGLAIPGPAPLPGAHRAAKRPSGSTPPAPLPGRPSQATATPSTPPPASATSEPASLESSLEVSVGFVAAAIGLALVVFFGLVYFLFL